MRSVACGTSHAVCLTTTGRVMSWGSGKDGQLGQAAHVRRSNAPGPVLLEDFTMYKVSQVVCGADHTLVSTSDGVVYAWGMNDFGQLGVGDRENRIQPEEVVRLRGCNTAHISAGGTHSAALSADGTGVYTWGDAIHGKLGHGDELVRLFPSRLDLFPHQPFTPSYPFLLFLVLPLLLHFHPHFPFLFLPHGNSR